MRLDRLRVVATLILPLLALAVGGCAFDRDVREGHDKLQGDERASDLEVLGAVLAALPGVQSNKYLVISSKSRALTIEAGWVKDQLEAVGRPVPTDLADLIVSYEARNAQSRSLAISESASIRLADSDYLARMFIGDVIGGWKRFWSRYPGADAMVELSLPGYSPSGAWAIMSYSASRGSINGDFVAVLLSHREGGWVVEWSQILFES